MGLLNQKQRTIVVWVLQLLVAGIFAIGSLPKFTGGATALAEKLPMGNLTVIAIGLAEVAAIVLIVIPRTALIGGGLATLVMLGAVGSHVVGLEGEFATMFVLALVALAGAVGVVALRWPCKCITDHDAAAAHA